MLLVVSLQSWEQMIVVVVVFLCISQIKLLPREQSVLTFWSGGPYLTFNIQKILKEVGRIVKTVYFLIKTFVHALKHLKSAKIDDNESITIVT